MSSPSHYISDSNTVQYNTGAPASFEGVGATVTYQSGAQQGNNIDNGPGRVLVASSAPSTQIPTSQASEMSLPGGANTQEPADQTGSVDASGDADMDDPHARPYNWGWTSSTNGNAPGSHGLDVDSDEQADTASVLITEALVGIASILGRDVVREYYEKQHAMFGQLLGNIQLLRTLATGINMTWENFESARVVENLLSQAHTDRGVAHYLLQKYEETSTDAASTRSAVKALTKTVDKLSSKVDSLLTSMNTNANARTEAAPPSEGQSKGKGKARQTSIPPSTENNEYSFNDISAMYGIPPPPRQPWVPTPAPQQRKRTFSEVTATPPAPTSDGASKKKRTKSPAPSTRASTPAPQEPRPTTPVNPVHTGNAANQLRAATMIAEHLPGVGATSAIHLGQRLFPVLNIQDAAAPGLNNPAAELQPSVRQKSAAELAKDRLAKARSEWGRRGFHIWVNVPRHVTIDPKDLPEVVDLGVNAAFKESGTLVTFVDALYLESVRKLILRSQYKLSGEGEAIKKMRQIVTDLFTSLWSPLPAGFQILDKQSLAPPMTAMVLNGVPRRDDTTDTERNAVDVLKELHDTFPNGSWDKICPVYPDPTVKVDAFIPIHRWIGNGRDMGTILFYILDEPNGSISRHHVTTIPRFHGAVLRCEYYTPREQVPLCRKCWRWGHTTFQCRELTMLCVRCGENHRTERHDLDCSQCKAAGPIVQDGEVRCPHEFSCLNCSKETHYADSSMCAYYVNRHNFRWHAAQTKAPKLQLHAKGKGKAPTLSQDGFTEVIRPSSRGNRGRRGGSSARGGTRGLNTSMHARSPTPGPSGSGGAHIEEVEDEEQMETSEHAD